MIVHNSKDSFEFRSGPKRSLHDGIFGYALLDYWPRLQSSGSVMAFDRVAHNYGSPGRVFKIDENGILEVLARDIVTGTDTIVTMGKTAVDVDDAAVEAMVGESVEHAFEDMAMRVFTEARLKADELIPAVENALLQGLANDSEKSEIITALDAVRSAMKSGAANPLKAAVQRLDAATESMAARIVEDAMNKALDRQLGETQNPLA